MQTAAPNPEIQITKSLDCTGQLCPMPVYKTSLALGQLAAGDVLEVICTDPGSLKDFPALAKQGGHELLLGEERGTTQVFLLRKGAAG
jgi:tRNA 2-thiouridine synthesizing protein A